MVADSSALCAAHSAPAIGPCERCGTFVCDQCGFRHGDRARCHKCGAPEVEKPPGMPLTAIILAAVGLMCPPFSLVGIAVALLWRYGDRRGPSLGVQYARWAVVVGLMSLVMGGAMYYWMGQLVWAAAQAAAAGTTTEHGSTATEPDPGKP